MGNVRYIGAYNVWHFERFQLPGIAVTAPQGTP